MDEELWCSKLKYYFNELLRPDPKSYMENVRNVLNLFKELYSESYQIQTLPFAKESNNNYLFRQAIPDLLRLEENIRMFHNYLVLWNIIGSLCKYRTQQNYVDWINYIIYYVDKSREIQFTGEQISNQQACYVNQNFSPLGIDVVANSFEICELFITLINYVLSCTNEETAKLVVDFTTLFAVQYDRSTFEKYTDFICKMSNYKIDMLTPSFTILLDHMVYYGTKVNRDNATEITKKILNNYIKKQDVDSVFTILSTYTGLKASYDEISNIIQLVRTTRDTLKLQRVLRDMQNYKMLNLRQIVQGIVTNQSILTIFSYEDFQYLTPADYNTLASADVYTPNLARILIFGIRRNAFFDPIPVARKCLKSNDVSVFQELSIMALSPYYRKFIESIFPDWIDSFDGTTGYQSLISIASTVKNAQLKNFDHSKLFNLIFDYLPSYYIIPALILIGDMKECDIVDAWELSLHNSQFFNEFSKLFKGRFSEIEDLILEEKTEKKLYYSILVTNAALEIKSPRMILKACAFSKYNDKMMNENNELKELLQIITKENPEIIAESLVGEEGYEILKQIDIDLIENPEPYFKMVRGRPLVSVLLHKIKNKIDINNQIQIPENSDASETAAILDAALHSQCSVDFWNNLDKDLLNPIIIVDENIPKWELECDEVFCEVIFNCIHKLGIQCNPEFATSSLIIAAKTGNSKLAEMAIDEAEINEDVLKEILNEPLGIIDSVIAKALSNNLDSQLFKYADIGVLGMVIDSVQEISPKNIFEKIKYISGKTDNSLLEALIGKLEPNYENGKKLLDLYFTFVYKENEMFNTEVFEFASKSLALFEFLQNINYLIRTENCTNERGDQKKAIGEALSSVPFIVKAFLNSENEENKKIGVSLANGRFFEEESTYKDLPIENNSPPLVSLLELLSRVPESHRFDLDIASTITQPQSVLTRHERLSTFKMLFTSEYGFHDTVSDIMKAIINGQIIKQENFNDQQITINERMMFVENIDALILQFFPHFPSGISFEEIIIPNQPSIVKYVPAAVVAQDDFGRTFSYLMKNGNMVLGNAIRVDNTLLPSHHPEFAIYLREADINEDISLEIAPHLKGKVDLAMTAAIQSNLIDFARMERGENDIELSTKLLIEFGSPKLFEAIFAEQKENRDEMINNLILAAVENSEPELNTPLIQCLLKYTPLMENTEAIPFYLGSWIKDKNKMKLAFGIIRNLKLKEDSIVDIVEMMDNDRLVDVTDCREWVLSIDYSKYLDNHIIRSIVFSRGDLEDAKMFTSEMLQDDEVLNDAQKYAPVPFIFEAIGDAISQKQIQILGAKLSSDPNFAQLMEKNPEILNTLKDPKWVLKTLSSKDTQTLVSGVETIKEVYNPDEDPGEEFVDAVTESLMPGSNPRALPYIFDLIYIYKRWFKEAHELGRKIANFIINTSGLSDDILSRALTASYYVAAPYPDWFKSLTNMFMNRFESDPSSKILLMEFITSLLAKERRGLHYLGPIKPYFTIHPEKVTEQLKNNITNIIANLEDGDLTALNDIDIITWLPQGIMDGLKKLADNHSSIHSPLILLYAVIPAVCPQIESSNNFKILADALNRGQYLPSKSSPGNRGLMPKAIASIVYQMMTYQTSFNSGIDPQIIFNYHAAIAKAIPELCNIILSSYNNVSPYSVDCKESYAFVVSSCFSEMTDPEILQVALSNLANVSMTAENNEFIAPRLQRALLTAVRNQKKIFVVDALKFLNPPPRTVGSAKDGVSNAVTLISFSPGSFVGKTFLEIVRCVLDKEIANNAAVIVEQLIEKVPDLIIPYLTETFEIVSEANFEELDEEGVCPAAKIIESLLILQDENSQE